MSAGEQLHYVALTPNGDGASSINFECKGGRDASCHNYPDCECEYWDDQHDSEHPRVPHDECWMKDWFENEGGTRYDGENADDMHDNGIPAGLTQSGPIRASYEYEGCVSWVFA